MIVRSDRDVQHEEASMMKPVDTERLTRYNVGGISPFGQKRRVCIAVKTVEMGEASIFINGGQRGLQMILAPDATRVVLAARVAALVA